MSHPPAASWTPEPLPRPESPRDDASPVARRRRRWPWVVGVLAVLLAALLGLGAWYAGSLGRTFDDHRQTVDVGALEQAAGNGPLNVLVLGSDSR